MKNAIELCVRRPVSVIMLLSALLTGGAFSLSVLPLQRMPEFPFPRVTVETLYPGLGAADIRQALTIPIEDALSSVKGLERIRSVSRDGASLSALDFRWGVDSGAASVLVREAIDAVYPSLPEGASKPVVIPGNSGEEAQIIVAVRSELGGVFARNLAEYEIRSILRRIDGVGSVMLSGGEKEELQVRIDLPKALSRGLPPAAVAEILAAETANIPAGNAREGDRELVVVSAGKPGTEAELGALVLPSRSGPFALGDLGTLGRGKARKESLFIAASGPEAAEYTALEVYRRPGADPVRLSRAVKKAVEEAASSFAGDAEITIIYDDAASIVPALQKLLISALLGTLAVMAVLLVTLRSFRYSVLAGLSLPLAMAASLAVLAALGRSLNSMSLSGIAMGIGLVSDTSVIILDLLHRRLGEKPTGGKSFRDPAECTAGELSEAAASVAASSFGGTLTTVIVFVPVIFLPGPLGSLFGDLSVSLVVSIIAGWLYAQFVLPSLFALFCVRPASSAGNKTSARPVSSGPGETSFVLTRYLSLLRFSLGRPFPVAGGAILACAAGLALLIARPASFIAPGDAAEVEVVLNFPPGTAMDSIAAGASALGRELRETPGVALAFGRAGSEEDDPGRRADPDYRRETFTFRCLLDPPGFLSPKPQAVLALVNEKLASNREALARFPRDPTEKLLGLSSVPVLAVKGRSPEDAERRSAEAEALIRREAFAALTARRPAGSRPELRVLPDREASAYAGISTAETARALYAAAEGLTAGELELEGRALKLKVSALEVPAMEALPVSVTETGPVFLGSLAGIEYREAPAALARLDRSDVFYLEASAEPGKAGALSKYIAELCASGKERGFGRADESAFERYRISLVITVILVLVLLYLTMGAEFESFTLPLVLLLAIPFSLAGAGPALFLAGAGLDSSSVLGLMVLFGISVNSGMILYELAAEKRALGIEAAEAVYAAAAERFRPVVTTALTTVFALLPLVLTPLGAGERSMAAAMLGGIAACTLLTLFALPPALVRFLRRSHG
ncbi:MAG: efflux RND transporter permease subunit [Spirochaetaceae bacterium]|nr:efflux RND transporter permease subunit [Spirochaetaceae bacterium]